MKKNFNYPKVTRAPEVYKLISNIRNEKKRNLLRGYSSKSSLSPEDVDIIRKGNSSHDSMIMGALLKGPHGLLEEQANKKRTSNDLFTITALKPLDWRNEVCYTAGYINSMHEEASEMLEAIKQLSRLDTLESEKALQLLLDLSKKYGASNYLSYKLAYIKSARDLPPTLLSVVSEIEDEIKHRDNAGMHFSALENLSGQISLLVVAKRRISGLVGRVDGEFRKSLSLSNFIPTPLNEIDTAGFLLRATESSLLDTIYSVLVIFNLSPILPTVRREIEQRLNPGLVEQFLDVISHAEGSAAGDIITDHYSQNTEDYTSLNLYRITAAFLETPKFAIYRNKVDRVIGVRLLAEIIKDKFNSIPKPIVSKENLLAPAASYLEKGLSVPLDTFYRTYLFLSYIDNKSNIIHLTKDDIKLIFENTLGLDFLLTEEEIGTLYLSSTPEMKSLVAVLALALYRTKSIDPDIDFVFRTDFIDHVNKIHNGSILNFINDLLRDSPEIATYLVGSLDEVTLEKMYSLIKNASEASQIRCEILRAVGQKLNRIEFFIEADAISTRASLSQLQQYFDSSRMYVDSVAMKKWLDSNPTISTEQYRALYPRIEARYENNNLLVIQLNDQDEYLISQIAKDAFEQFCLNTEFGIQSYLGRRIRHNTLDGVTTDTVDAVFRKSEYRSVMSNAHMQRTVDSWMAAYKSIIDKLRREHLQFKSNNSLFNAVLNLEDPATKDNLRILSNSLKTAGRTELLNDLLIAFCWRQITPQLENAARFIKTSLLQEVNASINKHFSGYHGVIEGQIKSELLEAINDVLKKVADWFQVPRTGFISASIREICQIILLELNRANNVEFSGNALDIKYTGISVHRLYDCLAVLLKNAHIHGEEGKEILVKVNTDRKDPENVMDYVSIDITSTVSEEKYFPSKERTLQAIDSTEAGIDMVTEGYTGIKKVKFITRSIEGFHTVRCCPNDESRVLELGFSIHAEPANEEIAMGESS